MRAFTEGTGFELSHIVNNFPWGDLKDGVVVDVSHLMSIYVRQVSITNAESRWEVLKGSPALPSRVNSRYCRLSSRTSNL